jgi:integrase
MGFPTLRIVAPTDILSTVEPAGPKMPIRPKNADLRAREHLFPAEIEALIAAAKDNRHGDRDALMILLAYIHGLRAMEVTGLKWEQVDFKGSQLTVTRAKGGRPSTHPLTGPELRALRAHKRQSPTSSPWLFLSERGAPMTPLAFSKMVERASVKAKLPIKTHAHMLRHSCGFKLANDGRDTRGIQQYLGHVSIMNTVKYTEQAAKRFDGWFDGD